MIKTLVKTFAKCLIGLVLIVVCGDAFHDEFVRPHPERSFWLLGFFGLGIVIGGLIMPYAGTWLKEAIHDGLGLASEARHVYDGERKDV